MTPQTTRLFALRRRLGRPLKLVDKIEAADTIEQLDSYREGMNHRDVPYSATELGADALRRAELQKQRRR